MAKNITDIDYHLKQEQEALQNVLTLLNKLCEHNKNLQGFIEIQKEVKELKKEHDESLPWFKKLINTISNIKYVFVKNEEQLAKDAIEQNNNLLKHIDDAVLSIAEKSAPLKQTLQQEVKKNFENLAEKKSLSNDQREKLSNLFYNEYAAKGEKFAPLTMVKPLHFSNAEELEEQRNYLNNIKQNIQNLLTENANIKEFKELQKQVAVIKEEIPLTFFEKLNNGWQKIKNIFVDNNEQILAKNKDSNTKAIKKIDQKLHEAEVKFKGLINDKEQIINETANKLSKDKAYKVYNSVVDLKSGDLISPIIQDEASKTQSEKPKFATVGKTRRAANIVKQNLESFEPKNNPISNTKKLFDSDLPESNFSNEKPAPTFSTFGKAQPKASESPTKIICDTIPLNDKDYQALEQIKNNVRKNSISELNDVASILAAKAQMDYSSGSDSGFTSNETTKSKKVLTRGERNTKHTQQISSSKKLSSLFSR